MIYIRDYQVNFDMHSGYFNISTNFIGTGEDCVQSFSDILRIISELSGQHSMVDILEAMQDPNLFNKKQITANIEAVNKVDDNIVGETVKNVENEYVVNSPIDYVEL